MRVNFIHLLLFFFLLLWLCGHTPALQEEYRKGHDASTVSRMLARIGEGTAHFETCRNEECKEEVEEEELCWGYEKGCSKEKRLFVPHCDEPALPWTKTLEQKHEMFWHQGDFGYIKNEVDSMMLLCHPNQKDRGWTQQIKAGASLLKCSAHLKYCRAQNLYIDFRRYKEMIQKEGRYRSFLEDIFEEGEIGGHCEFDAKSHHDNGDHKSPLQSWYAELEKYTPLDFKIDDENCDEIIEKPTIFIKLDAVVNLYHHYCDFFNIYASQHINGSFSDDIQIVIWDTTSAKRLHDVFIETWDAFTKNPILMLSHFEGKRVCFRDVVFPLLARMRHGLYYNTYLLPGCHGSGLMQAFIKHLVPRLGIRQEPSDPGRVRVTLLSRSTRQRRILNEDKLVKAMKTVGFFDVKVVDYKYRVFPFLEQVKTSHNSDLFMGIHGSGLTHMLFLPDWAGVFEMYNTEDPKCYHDLARLRGIQYITWEDNNKIWREAEGYSPTTGKPNPKFTNYTLDLPEFMRLVLSLGDSVRQRKMEALSDNVFSTHN